MRKMMVALALSVFGCIAQTLVPIQRIAFPEDLRQYLTLSDSQIGRIIVLNSRLESLRAEKRVRQSQVQREIAEWTAKEDLDSLALGLRYAELEAICRELDDEHKKTVSQVQALLTAEQRAKLAVLQQALTLYSTACSAANRNMLTPPVYATFVLGIVNTVSFSVSAPPCSSVPAGDPRSGDFSVILP